MRLRKFKLLSKAKKVVSVKSGTLNCVHLVIEVEVLQSIVYYSYKHTKSLGVVNSSYEVIFPDVGITSDFFLL